MIKKITTIILSVIPTFVLAATNSKTVGIVPPLGNTTSGGSDLKTIFLNVIDVVQTIMIMITVLYLIYAGLKFVTARGDAGKIKEARNALLWGLVGAALILCAEVLAYGLGDTVKEVFKGN